MSLVRFRPKAPFADVAHLVERHLAKVEVAGSNPVIRSKNPGRFYDPDFLSAQYAVCANGQHKASPRQARVAHSLASFPSYFKKILSVAPLRSANFCFI